MKIGVSLPPGYLAGQESGTYSEALGPPSAFLRELRQCGVAAVELRSVNSDADPDTAVAAAGRLAEAGLGMTVHGQLPPDADNPALCPALRALARATPQPSAGRLMVTIHAYRSDRLPSEELAGQTALAVLRLAEQADAEGLALHWAVELTRPKERQDPGASPPNLLALVQRINRPDVGICLDVGHSHSNILRGCHAFDFSEAFVRRVVHVHVHDVGPEGQTHFPLTCANLPLGEYCRLLARHGYGGILNLELSPQRFAHLCGLREALLDSVRVLAGDLRTEGSRWQLHSAACGRNQSDE